MMNDILRRIYEGDLHLEEQMVPATEEYYKQKALVRELEDAFYEILPAEFKDDYIRIIEERIRLAGIEVEEACLNGMRLGGQIASAFYKRHESFPNMENSESEP